MSDIIFNGGKAEGVVSPPPSKSYTHRAILLSALSGEKCTITSPLISLDTLATMDAVRSMGIPVENGPSGIVIGPGKIHAPDRMIDVKNSGTTLRLITGILSLFPSRSEISGDDSILKRPMAPLLDALSACGVECDSDEGRPPVSIKGPITGNTLTIGGGVSSQFISSLLMLSPMTGREMTVKVTGSEVSKPYIDITVSMMRKFGADVKECGMAYVIKPTGYSPADFRVPSDFSSAAFPLTAGGLSGKVTVDGMDMDDPQGDKGIVDVLTKTGCDVSVSGNSITCTRKERPRHADVDVSCMPDLFPIIAVLMSTADGTSRLYGAPHLRFKESDRIDLTEKMLRALGADITGTSDGCVINGVPKLHGGRIEHCGDHRILMAAAIASLIADGPVSMADDSCWDVSYPGFPEQMSSLGIRIKRN